MRRCFGLALVASVGLAFSAAPAFALSLTSEAVAVSGELQRPTIHIDFVERDITGRRDAPPGTFVVVRPPTEFAPLHDISASFLREVYSDAEGAECVD